ncbi:fused MFS/spermidine synthase [Subtercola sp. RTI3]|uniref:spermidine synthase n=1 Tax=Subtercola sp. RTI3 TaxID=3048639 RepID=UPI002B238E3B|nr:fused MFS/spermidine synthase [Subtercola sp. RTI3]MEA9983789.1 fused MFS/spermidine synthase [Subtercola sp. RTI3]
MPAQPPTELTLVDAATGTWLLTVDGVLQSQVSLTDPTVLEFDYVRVIARAIDAWAAPGVPLSVAHLGGGALTLPRYVAATRPGSVQWVVERDEELSRAMLAVLPLPAGHDICLLYGDARDLAARADLDVDVCADVTVVDLWAGAVISARVASLEFYALVTRRMAPGALLAVNLLDGPGFVDSRGQAATLAALFTNVAVVVRHDMTSNTEIGNVVLFASDSPLGFAVSTGSLSAETPPPRVLIGDEAHRFIGNAPVVTDATASDSPPPDEEHFRAHAGEPWPAA